MNHVTPDSMTRERAPSPNHCTTAGNPFGELSGNFNLDRLLLVQNHPINRGKNFLFLFFGNMIKLTKTLEIN